MASWSSKFQVQSWLAHRSDQDVGGAQGGRCLTRRRGDAGGEGRSGSPHIPIAIWAKNRAGILVAGARIRGYLWGGEGGGSSGTTADDAENADEAVECFWTEFTTPAGPGSANPLAKFWQKIISQTFCQVFDGCGIP